MRMLIPRYTNNFTLSNEPKNVSNTTILICKIVFYSLLGFYLTFTAITFPLYIRRARRLRDRSLKERSLFLLTLQTVGGVIYGTSSLLHNAVPLYPCFIDFWLLYIGYIIWLYAFALRVLRFYIQSRSHAAIGDETRDNPIQPGNMDEHLVRLRKISGRNYIQSTSNTNRLLPAAGSTSGQRQNSFTISLLSFRLPSIHRPSLTDTVKSRTSTSSAAVATSPAIIEPKDNDQGIHFMLHGRHASDSSQHRLRNNDTQNSPQRNTLRSRALAKLVRGIMSNRTVGITLLCLLTVVSIGLLFTNIYMKLLSLNPMHYNCTSTWEVIPLTIIAGAAYFIVFPIFVKLIWRYHDAYGIRNSLIICSVLGMVMWGVSFAWGASVYPLNSYISPSMFTWAQIFAIYIYSVVVPLLESYIIAYRERRKSSTDDRDRLISQPGRPTRFPFMSGTQSEINRGNFYRALQDPDELEKLKQFAVRCFCSELMLLLDSYVALKASIHLDLQTHETPEHGTKSSPTPNAMAPVPDILRPPERTYNPQPVGSITGNSRIHASQEVVAPFLIDDALHSRSPESRLAKTASFGVGLTNITVSIVQTMAKAFPLLNIDASTTITERLRGPVSAFLATFILPESSLAINTSSRVVGAAQEYLNGGTITMSYFDRIKDDVLDLLYSNVYVRFKDNK